jgi:superfamily II DNA helicase RecQ
MPNRRHRPPIPVTLTLPAEPPTPAEIDAILMAVDAIAGSAGRTGVVQILHGSHSQKVTERGWDQLPEYGVFSGRHGQSDRPLGQLVYPPRLGAA